MTIRGRRAVVWLLLAGYAFAVTASSSFHDHGPDGTRRAAWDHHSGDLGHCVPWSEPAFGSRTAVAAGEESFAQSAHDGCAVCQFLAQKVLLAQPVTAIGSEALCARAVCWPSLPVIASRILTHQSRAPPCFA